MYIRKSKKYNKKIKIIYPGEFFVSENDEIIGTLLGSCISVCLFDPGNGIAGMNHYMLPGKITNNDIFSDNSARYGINAINELIVEMKKKGARMNDLIAKVFGGGHVLSIESSENIPIDNIRLARVMMEMEDVPIEEIDVGANCARKILMDVKTGKVYLKKIIAKKVSQDVEEREKSYARSQFKDYGKN